MEKEEKKTKLEELQVELFNELKNLPKTDDFGEYQVLDISLVSSSDYDYISSYVNIDCDIDSLIKRYKNGIKEKSENLIIRLEEIDKTRFEKYISFYTKYYVSELENKFKKLKS